MLANSIGKRRCLPRYIRTLPDMIPMCCPWPITASRWKRVKAEASEKNEGFRQAAGGYRRPLHVPSVCVKEAEGKGGCDKIAAWTKITRREVVGVAPPRARARRRCTLSCELLNPLKPANQIGPAGNLGGASLDAAGTISWDGKNKLHFQDHFCRVRWRNGVWRIDKMAFPLATCVYYR